MRFPAPASGPARFERVVRLRGNPGRQPLLDCPIRVRYLRDAKALVLLTSRRSRPLQVQNFRTYLQQQLDPLDGRHRRLGDGRGHSTCQEVLGEGHGGICHTERKEEAGDNGTTLETGLDSGVLGRSEANGRFI
ncbi:hypothetical protein MC885_003383 [Smutsia gigantea]|nr:hypothetical protein MC885_003383 [Smutsia gigantea]